MSTFSKTIVMTTVSIIETVIDKINVAVWSSPNQSSAKLPAKLPKKTPPRAMASLPRK